MIDRNIRRNTLMRSTSMNSDLVTHMRFVATSDADFICGLRSDNALNQHISKTDVSVEAQVTWIKNYKNREAQGDEFYFTIIHKNQRIGLVRMYDFRGDSFCWGSWIILPSRPSGLVTYSAYMIYEIGFEIIGFSNSHFDVRLGNEKVINFHLRSGANPSKRTDTDQYFLFSKEMWHSFRDNSTPQMRMHRTVYT